MIAIQLDDDRDERLGPRVLGELAVEHLQPFRLGGGIERPLHRIEDLAKSASWRAFSAASSGLVEAICRERLVLGNVELHPREAAVHGVRVRRETGGAARRAARCGTRARSVPGRRLARSASRTRASPSPWGFPSGRRRPRRAGESPYLRGSWSCRRGGVGHRRAGHERLAVVVAEEAVERRAHEFRLLSVVRIVKCRLLPSGKASPERNICSTEMSGRIEARAITSWAISSSVSPRGLLGQRHGGGRRLPVPFGVSDRVDEGVGCRGVALLVLPDRRGRLELHLLVLLAQQLAEAGLVADGGQRALLAVLEGVRRRQFRRGSRRSARPRRDTRNKPRPSTVSTPVRVKK